MKWEVSWNEGKKLGGQGVPITPGYYISLI